MCRFGPTREEVGRSRPRAHKGFAGKPAVPTDGLAPTNSLREHEANNKSRKGQTMRALSFKLSDPERDYLTRRATDERITVSAYLRRLVQADIHHAESDALVALSLDAMVEAQRDQLRLLNLGLHTISDQLNELKAQEAQTAEQASHVHTRLLSANDATADLVAAALTECHTILDADNSLLETIDRRLKAIQKPC
jgi:hypothetical protein